MIGSTFGLHSPPARGATAMALRRVLRPPVTNPAPASAIPTSDQVPGPATDAASVCSAASVQSVSPAPVSRHGGIAAPAAPPVRPTANGMAALARRYPKARHHIGHD